VTRIASTDSLLHAAIQDLHAGASDQARRLPADAARDDELVALLSTERRRSAERATRLEGTGLNTSGPANLWMAGVLDDAERDAKGTEPGRLLDIALAGAIRKGKAAEVVACDTALALVGDDQAIAEAVATFQAESSETDQALLAIIRRLAA
jgi:hypothetical protein